MQDIQGRKILNLHKVAVLLAVDFNSVLKIPSMYDAVTYVGEILRACDALEVWIGEAALEQVLESVLGSCQILLDLLLIFNVSSLVFEGLRGRR